MRIWDQIPGTSDIQPWAGYAQAQYLMWWVGDLPRATERALWKKHRHKLMFPAGLEKELASMRRGYAPR